MLCSFHVSFLFVISYRKPKCTATLYRIALIAYLIPPAESKVHGIYQYEEMAKGFWNVLRISPTSQNDTAEVEPM
jgi:hypothetical protein